MRRPDRILLRSSAAPARILNRRSKSSVAFGLLRQYHAARFQQDALSDEHWSPSESHWRAAEHWWIGMGERLQVADRAESFFKAAAAGGLLDRIGQVGGQVDYILFVLMRYWVPTVPPPAGRERLTKSDADYWLESEQILKAAATRLRELKPLIELLTTPNPVSDSLSGQSVNPSPVTELELSSIIEGLAEAAGSYGGPTIRPSKAFDPFPFGRHSPSSTIRSTALNFGSCFCCVSIFESWARQRPVLAADRAALHGSRDFGPEWTGLWA